MGNRCSIQQSEENNCSVEQSPEKLTVSTVPLFLGHPVYLLEILSQFVHVPIFEFPLRSSSLILIIFQHGGFFFLLPVVSTVNMGAVDSKNTLVQRDPEKGSKNWPGNQSTWRGLWPRAGSIWPHYLSSPQKSDQIPGPFVPERSMSPNGPISGSHWPVCFQRV